MRMPLDFNDNAATSFNLGAGSNSMFDALTRKVCGRLMGADSSPVLDLEIDLIVIKN